METVTGGEFKEYVRRQRVQMMRAILHCETAQAGELAALCQTAVERQPQEVVMEKGNVDLIRRFGTTAGCAMYVHKDCTSSFLATLASEGKAFKPDSLVHWQYDELMGTYSDITSCDGCGKAFQPTDEQGYVSGWVSSLEDLAILQQIHEEGVL